MSLSSAPAAVLQPLKLEANGLIAMSLVTSPTLLFAQQHVKACPVVGVVLLQDAPDQGLKQTYFYCCSHPQSQCHPDPRSSGASPAIR